MKKHTQNIYNKENAEIALKLLATQISVDDKRRLAEDERLSIFTVAKYLRGEIENPHTAERIIKYLTKLIEKRNAVSKKAIESIA